MALKVRSWRIAAVDECPLWVTGLNRSRGRGSGSRGIGRSTGEWGVAFWKRGSFFPHPGQEHHYDRGDHQSTAPAYDRGHDDPQLRAEDAARRKHPVRIALSR